VKKWKWLAAALLLGALVAVYFEPTRCVRGWLWGEAFFDGRPTSLWADEIEQWDPTISFGNLGGPHEMYARRPRYPDWLRRFLTEPEPQWPRLLDGDPDGLLVLEELRQHPSENVRDWAEIGIERINNDERGPQKHGIGRPPFNFGLPNAHFP
jgi:hypothetical protein